MTIIIEAPDEFILANEIEMFQGYGYLVIIPPTSNYDGTTWICKMAKMV